jgi:hypothetical protein
VARGDQALRAGLKAASERFARAMKTVAGVRTRTSAAAVNVVEGQNENLIRAGRPTGPWGWEPIQASMFDNNRRHPLFGNKSKWYKQGRYPITQYTERAAIDDAAEAFADAFVPAFVKEYGFDK